MASELGGLVAQAVIRTDEANKSLADLQGALQRTGQQAKKTGQEMQQGAGKGMEGLGRGAGQANLLMTQMAFTLQDMPYFLTNFRMGIMAVSNNIGMIIANFAQMQVTMGSTGAMFQALLATIKGPMGIMIGFSILISVVQALSMALGKNEEAASTLADTYERFRDISKKMGTIELEKAMEKNASELAIVQKDIKEYARRINEPILLAPGVFTTGAILRQHALKREGELLQENYALRVRQQELMESRQLPGMQEQLEYQLEQLREQAKQEVYLTRRMELNDQIAKIEEQLANLGKSSADREKDAKEAREKELELEQRRQELIRANLEEQREGYALLYGIQRDAAEREGDEWQQRRTRADNEHADRMSDIDEAAIKVDDYREVEATRDAERARYRRELAEIEKDEADDRLRKADELARKERARLDDLAQGLAAVGNAINTIVNPAAHTFLGQLVNALRVATEIIHVINALRASTVITDLFGQIFGIARTVAPGAAGAGAVTPTGGSPDRFASGGYTGPIAAERVAGVVHGGEYVFEKPLVDRYHRELATLRSAMQHQVRGYQGGGAAVELPIRRGQEWGGAERTMRIEGRVDLSNGKLYLQQVLPEVERFLKKKILDR